MRNNHGTLKKWVSKFGDPIFINALNGPIIVTGRPDLIETIFNADPASYETFAKNTLQPILGAGSMLQLRFCGVFHRIHISDLTMETESERLRSLLCCMANYNLRSLDWFLIVIS